MTKYSFEFKKNIVQAYLNGEGGYTFLTTKYGVSDKSIIRRWVKAYKSLGDDGLKRSRQKNIYF